MPSISLEFFAQIAPFWYFGLAALYGAAFGSFGNVVTWRLPRSILQEQTTAQSGLWSRSACSHCHTQLSLWENIPIVSYLILRGRCKHCGVRYGARYFIAELCWTGVALACAFSFQNQPLNGVAVFVGLYLTGLAVQIDLEHQLLPWVLSGALAMAGFALMPLGSLYWNWQDALVAGIGVFAFFEALRWLVFKLKGIEGLGGGDGPFAGALFVWIGNWQFIGQFLIAACLVFILLSIVTRSRRCPFGPGLAAGALYCFMSMQGWAPILKF